MSVLIEVPFEDGGSVVVEAPEEVVSAGVVRAARPGQVAKQAGETFESALDNTLVPVARAVVGRVKELGPQTVEISLGLKLAAEAGAVISKVAGEASLVVKLTWERERSGGS
jgi:hypothetical protein